MTLTQAKSLKKGKPVWVDDGMAFVIQYSFVAVGEDNPHYILVSKAGRVIDVPIVNAHLTEADGYRHIADQCYSLAHAARIKLKTLEK